VREPCHCHQASSSLLNEFSDSSKESLRLPSLAVSPAQGVTLDLCANGLELCVLLGDANCYDENAFNHGVKKKYA
jgi:hypothetical protein